MQTIEKDVATNFRWLFDSNYGTITESNFEVLVQTSTTEEYFTAGDVTFTVVQPVVDTSDGSLTVSLTISTTGVVKATLFEVSTGKSVGVKTLLAKCVEIDPLVVGRAS